MRQAWLQIGLLFLLSYLENGLTSGQAVAAERVRVTLFQAHAPLSQIILHGPFQLSQPGKRNMDAGIYTIKASHHQLRLCSAFKSNQCIQAQRFILNSVQAEGITLAPPNTIPRQYPGQLKFSLDKLNTLQVVNQVPFREYVTIVVSSETPPNWPLEALKAQAVLTQTRMLRYLASDALDDTTQREVYLGNTHRRPEVAQAVAAVWGQKLTLRGHLITPFYHASCAGHTSSEQIFGTHQHLPGITGVPCSTCRLAVFGKPTITTISAKDYSRAFPMGIPQVKQRDEAGRPLLVRFPNGKTESGYAFWLTLGQKLGWDKAPGLRFSWMQNKAGEIKITSSGAGHGVGLCQQGAAGMARQGKSYRQILEHYFPNTQLTGN